MFNIARTRNALGGLSVTSCQYPEEMTPSCIIQEDEISGQLTVEEILEETSTAECETDSKPQKSGKNNPLRWFGVLIPAHLRNAQARFKEGNVVSVMGFNIISPEVSCRL